MTRKVHPVQVDQLFGMAEGFRPFDDRVVAMPISHQNRPKNQNRKIRLIPWI